MTIGDNNKRCDAMPVIMCMRQTLLCQSVIVLIIIVVVGQVTTVVVVGKQYHSVYVYIVE